MLNPKKVEEIVREFFEKMTFEVEVEVFSQVEASLPIKIKTDEPQILIGQGGETLAEIQRLLRIILRKQLAEDFFPDIDINEYKEKKAEYLKELAKEVADDVSLTKKERELTPMSAYERRVVHMSLAERVDVVSESVGEGTERRIVIKPRP
ncbi:MAG: R3H domain-containing nucleic acid-binding protein [bacterium]|nr:R3H domain-containing nucleic acid-binding protein [bacterium]